MQPASLLRRLRSWLSAAPPEDGSAAAGPGSPFDSELAYWDLELSLKGTYPHDILDRTQPERMVHIYPAYIDPLLREVAERRKCRPAVLDVGSGPLSMLIYGAENGIFDLTCADPLADAYVELLAKYGYPVRTKMVCCAGEELSGVFGAEAFDIVWMHNALDHSQWPQSVFREMVRVLRPGGYMVVQGWTREGAAEAYEGLHQHDLYIARCNRLMCETHGERRARRCLNRGLPLDVIECSQPDRRIRQWMRVIFRKRQ